jgi:hypothetical protein
LPPGLRYPMVVLEGGLKRRASVPVRSSLAGVLACSFVVAASP